MSTDPRDRKVFEGDLDPYYGHAGKVWKHPVHRLVAGGETISIGFPIAQLTEYVKSEHEPVEVAVASLMNLGDRMCWRKLGQLPACANVGRFNCLVTTHDGVVAQAYVDPPTDRRGAKWFYAHGGFMSQPPLAWTYLPEPFRPDIILETSQESR